MTCRSTCPLLLVALLFLAPVGAFAQSLHASDGSQDPPKLWIAVNLWGLMGLPDGQPEWSLDEKLSRLKAAGGFDAVDRYVAPEPKSEAAVAELDAAAKKHGFRVGMHTHIDRLEQLDPAIALARKVGTPYVDVMTGPYYVGEEETVRLLRALTQRFKAEKIAMMLQTHRGLVTQDVLRTVSYTRQIPDLRFDLDLSHYVAAGELGDDFPPAATEAFDAIMARAGMLDGRVSNGEQVQIDIGPAGDTPHARRFAAVWKKAMAGWLKRAGKGDVLPFRIELGPPDYAIRDLSAARSRTAGPRPSSSGPSPSASSTRRCGRRAPGCPTGGRGNGSRAPPRRVSTSAGRLPVCSLRCCWLSPWPSSPLPPSGCSSSSSPSRAGTTIWPGGPTSSASTR